MINGTMVGAAIRLWPSGDLAGVAANPRQSAIKDHLGIDRSPERKCQFATDYCTSNYGYSDLSDGAGSMMLRKIKRALSSKLECEKRAVDVIEKHKKANDALRTELGKLSKALKQKEHV